MGNTKAAKAIKKTKTATTPAAKAVQQIDDDINTNAALYIGQALTKQDASGNAFYQKFIDSLLRTALKDPNSRAGQLLASTMFTPDILNRLGQEANKTRQNNIDFSIYQIRQTLYDEQKQVFDNDSDDKIIIICSRRAGKTELNARKLLKAVLHDNTPCLYLNRTFDNAINQLYDLFLKLADELGIKTANGTSKSNGVIVFANGSSVRFGGVNDIAAIDKYRGYKYRLVIIDEIGHLKNTQYLIDEVLTPATADFEKSQMIFTGTPPRVKNFATKLWHSNIKKYHWTAAVNPFIPDFEAFIDRVCEEKGLTRDDPFIQREYYGNMDAYDTNAIVFKKYKTYSGLSQLQNGCVEIPTWADNKITFHPTDIYIGIDWGGTDNNAIVCTAVDAIGKHALVYDVWTDKGCGLEIIKATIQKKYNEAQELLNTYGIDEDRIKIITDTNMVEFCVDLHKLGLPVSKALKYDMMTSVENLASLMRTGKILVPSQWTEDDNFLIKDLNCTVYERDEETDELTPKIDDGTYHPDAMHALRYAMRMATSNGQWSYSEAASNREADKTVPAGLENLKDYGVIDIPTGSSEEFVI